MNIEKLVVKARRGNHASFEKLINEYKHAMYLSAKSILRSDQDCADAIQEATLKVFKNLHQLKEPSYFKTWLIRIVMNECYTLIRKQLKVIKLDEWTEPIYEDSGYHKMEVKQMLLNMPSEQREILTLFYIVGLSIKELTELMNIPENTVKSRMHRARQKMKTLWMEQEEEELSWKNGKMIYEK